MIVWWLEVIVVTSLLTNLIVNSTFTGFTAQKKSNNGILCPPATMTCNRQDMAAPNWTGHWIGDSSVTKIAAIWCQRARVLQISTWHRELGHKEWQIAAIEGWQERAAQMHHGLLSHTLWMAMLHWKRNSLVGWPSVDQIANSFGQLSCWRLAWKQLQVDFAPVTLRRSVKIREGWGQPMSTSYLIYCDILWYTWPGRSPCNLSDLSLLILESEGLDVLDYTMQQCSTDIPQPVQDRLYHNVANCGKYKD